MRACRSSKGQRGWLEQTFRLFAIALLIALLPGCHGAARVDRKSADERYKLVSDNLSKLAIGGSISRIVAVLVAVAIE